MTTLGMTFAEILIRLFPRGVGVAVTNRLNVDVLAKGPRESVEAMANRLAELRSRGATILECIKYVKLNQDCSLSEAKNIVVNSPVWFDQRDAFLRHQQEQFEEFLASNKDEIESIEQTITSDETTVVVRMKPPVGPIQGSAKETTAADGGRDLGSS